MKFFQWRFLLVTLGMLSCVSNVQGLKCYVCGLWNCNLYDWLYFEEPRYAYFRRQVSEFLVECKQSAISCATLSAETKDPYSLTSHGEKWFQRICLYPGDVTCIGGDPHNFPEELPWGGDSYFFPDYVSCINSYRKANSIPEIRGPESDSLLQIKGKSPHMVFEACRDGSRNITDGCNHWHQTGRYRTPIALAEGFPMELHEQRKKAYKTNCYKCSTGNTGSHQAEVCENHFKLFNKDDQARDGAYGCAMFAIYQIAGGMEEKHYFERGLWFPGDQWCLERKYDSTQTGRTLGKMENANVRYFKRPGKGECTKNDYSRALKGRELSYNFEWIGQKEFYSAEEFSEFLRCRWHVTNKLKIQPSRPYMNYDDAAAAKAWAGKTGVFASVGFRFCGPDNFCNDWTGHQLYEVMNDPPPTSTTLKPNVTSTTTPNPTKTPPGTGDGCYKNSNKAPKRVGSLSNDILLVTLLQAGIIPHLLLAK